MKTVRFKEGRYIGDPLNAVRIFNEKEVDELIVLDIDATAQQRVPDFVAIEHLAAECRMPLCYGGGVKTIDQALRIFDLGVEKIAMSSAAIENPAFVGALAERVGTQSVVVVLDVKRKAGSRNYEVIIRNGSKPTGKDPADMAYEMQTRGAGEIVINSIDNDGMMAGYDTEVAQLIRSRVTLPVTVLGGASSLKDIGELIRQFGIIGAAAGSLFIFKGSLKAVLINYPTSDAKDEFIRMSLLPPAGP